MSYRLPPLNALRAYEAAARHLSFKLAAHELNVTPGAISQQVKALEDVLGIQLFKRMHQSLLLTDTGQAYLPPIRNAFRMISDATERIVPGSVPKTLTVGVQSLFAVKWLLPRLNDFIDRHPAIDVQINTAIDFADLKDGRVDAIIRQGLGEHPGLRSDLVLYEKWTPVCSPGLFTGDPALRTPDDLRYHALLHDEFREKWAAWLNVHDVHNVDGTRGLRFSDERLAIQAAIAGQGVALGRRLLIEEPLRDGRLVRLFELELNDDFAFYLFTPQGTSGCTEIVALRNWLLSQVETHASDIERSERVR